MQATDRPVRVSIAVCTHNRAKHLIETLESISDVGAPVGWDVELLLIDNASTDTTPEIVERYQHPEFVTRAVFEGNKGVSYARNKAISEFTGQVLLFTDDDTRLPANWVEKMCSPILDGRADAVSGGVKLTPELHREWMKPLHRGLLASTERIQAGYTNEFVGANMSIGRHVFDKIPKFDPELGPGQLGLAEETLFAKQINEAGMRILALPDVIVEHHPDTERLKYSAFCSAAIKGGYSSGYISYHWEHNKHPYALLRCAKIYLSSKLRLMNTLSKSARWEEEGMASKEFLLRRKLARIEFHIKNRGVPFRYDKRGLVKM